MNNNFEETLSGSLKDIVSNVTAEPNGIEASVTQRIATLRRRRKAAAAVVGGAAAVSLLVGAPFVVLQEGARSHATSAGPPSNGIVNPDVSNATRYGEHLLELVKLPPGGASADAPPVHALAHPTSHLLLTPTPVHVSRWWTYQRSAGFVWQWVTHTKNPGLTSEETIGSEFPVPPGQLPPVNSVLFEPTVGLPDGFVYGDVTVLVASLGHNRAGIAVIATVEPRPPRPPAEDVPTSHVRAVVAWHRKPGGPLVHTTLDPAAAVQLAQAFDVLPLATISEHGCSLLRGDDEVMVAFRADGHQWRATYVGCFDVTVALDGNSLPALTTSTSEATSRPPGQGTFLSELKTDGIRLP